LGILILIRFLSWAFLRFQSHFGLILTQVINLEAYDIKEALFLFLMGRGLLEEYKILIELVINGDSVERIKILRDAAGANNVPQPHAFK